MLKIKTKRIKQQNNRSKSCCLKRFKPEAKGRREKNMSETLKNIIDIYNAVNPVKQGS